MFVKTLADCYGANARSLSDISERCWTIINGDHVRSFRLAIMIGVVACGGEATASTSPAPLGLPGVYVLTTMNGQPVPYTLLKDSHTELTWMADTIRIVANGTYSERRWIRFTETGSLTPYPVLLEGTWTRFGTSGAHLDAYDPSDHLDVLFSDAGLDAQAVSLKNFYARCSRC